jgi:hypothetical protein
MTLTDLDDFCVVSQLPHSERVSFATRCARIAVRLLNSLSLPIRLKEMASLETIVCLLEEWTDEHELAALGLTMQKLRPLAFATPDECKYRGDSIVCQVVHAAYAAGLTAFTGSSVYADDAFKSALAAARTVESKEAEESLRQELRRARKIGTEAAHLKRKMSSHVAQPDFVIA